MKNLRATEDTYWFAYEPSTDTFCMGVTEAGLVTSTAATEFEHGADVLTKIEAHKNKLRTPDIEDIDDDPQPGFYLNRGKVKLLKKEHCIGKANLYLALEDHPDNNT